MKILILARHGDAENQSTTDNERALTPLGEKQASQVGRALAPLGVIDYLATSVSKRTQQTARLILKALPQEPAYACHDSVRYGREEDLIGFIQNLPDWITTALIVGHNPTISMVTQSLVATPGRASFAPADSLRLSFEVENWAAVDAGQGQITHDFRQS